MRQIGVTLFLLLLLLYPCAAAELNQALPEQSRSLLEGIDENEADLEQGLERIWEAIRETVSERLPESMHLMGTLLLIVLLCALLDGIGLGAGRILPLTGVLAIVGSCTEGISGIFALGEQTLNQLHSFSTALLAALAAALASSGGVHAGTALYAGTAFFLNLLLQLITNLLLPLVYGYLTAAAAAAALRNETLQRVGELLKWFVSICLKLLTTAFVAYLSITGIVSGNADSSAVKAMKLAVSAAVPVVGSIISDASETVLVTAGLVKNAVGIFGMLGVMAIGAVPFARIGLRYLVLKCTAALAGVVDRLALTKLLDALSSAMGMVLAMTAIALLMMLFSCVCALRMVNP